MMAEISGTLNHPDGLVLHAASGDEHAMVVARTLAWDTAFFGLRMARIEYVLATNVALVADTIRSSIETLRSRGIQHVSARVDVEDIETMATLESEGFRLMDA